MNSNPGAAKGMPAANPQLGAANISGLNGLGNIGMPGLGLDLQN